MKQKFMGFIEKVTEGKRLENALLMALRFERIFVTVMFAYMAIQELAKGMILGGLLCAGAGASLFVLITMAENHTVYEITKEDIALKRAELERLEEELEQMKNQ